ncbi:hypothetical protein E2C01_093325 [Portunus trituberculatus]|nr:hypothetical protein [Portunus trituberculatus]
MGPRLAN